MSTIHTSLTAFLLLFWADFAITAYALLTGSAFELNPGLPNLYLMAAAKAAVTSFTLILAARMPSQELHITFRMLGIVYAMVVLWNLAQV